MKLTIRDIIIIGVITVLSFPVMYFTMLFVTGNAKIVFASKETESVEGGKKLKYMKHSKRKDSLIVTHSQAYLASARERLEVKKEREQLAKQQERIKAVLSLTWPSFWIRFLGQAPFKNYEYQRRSFKPPGWEVSIVSRKPIILFSEC